jgi:ferredoxin--NADP+ reductase
MQQIIENIINKIELETEDAIAQALDQITTLGELSDSEIIALTEGLTNLFYQDHGGMTRMIALAIRAEKQIVRFGPATLPVLIGELVNADAESSAHLGRAIALNGADAVDPVLAAWNANRSNDLGLINLCQALAYFRVTDVLRALPEIMVAAKSANYHLRSVALDTMGKLALRLDGALIDENIRLKMFDNAFGLLSDTHSLVRMHAARSLGKMLKKGILTDEEKGKLSKAYNAILGKSDDDWDDAYIVRHEAKHYRPLLMTAEVSVARYQQSFMIISKRELCPNTFHYVIEAPLIARKLQAGQFIIIRPHQQSERIPLSICGWDRKQGHIEIIVMSAGKSTREINAMQEGDRFADIVGPLGERSHIRQHHGTCVVIGGGYGTGAIIPTARDLKALGCKVVGIVGARSKELLIMVDELGEICDETITTTNDGSDGIQGFVTDALKEVIQREARISHVLAIGPVPMMQAVCDLTRPYKIETIVSLNAIMVDGTGMCGACRVSIDGKTRFACFHGPDFDGHKVDFDQLTKRQKMFVSEEQKALETR